MQKYASDNDSDGKLIPNMADSVIKVRNEELELLIANSNHVLPNSSVDIENSCGTVDSELLMANSNTDLKLDSIEINTRKENSSLRLKTAEFSKEFFDVHIAKVVKTQIESSDLEPIIEEDSMYSDVQAVNGVEIQTNQGQQRFLSPLMDGNASKQLSNMAQQLHGNLLATPYNLLYQFCCYVQFETNPNFQMLLYALYVDIVYL
ncbi:hypothetical protein L1887_19949 [Cichorium endivia]|nr:hypothetical protein L1887_19949 [Cichorium endivia]